MSMKMAKAKVAIEIFKHHEIYRHFTYENLMRQTLTSPVILTTRCGVCANRPRPANNNIM